MGIFRSEAMGYYELLLPSETARDFVEELGRIGGLQFIDLNAHQTAFQRNYVNYTKRCDEMERKLRVFVEQAGKYDIKINKIGDVQDFLESLKTQMNQREQDSDGHGYLDELENLFEEYDRELTELNSYNERLTREYNEKVEMKHVIEKASTFIQGANWNDALSRPSRSDSDLEHGASRRAMESPLLTSVDGPLASRVVERSMRFSYLTGVVATSDTGRFERMLFRATKGNTYALFSPIDEAINDPVTNAEQHKSVFIVFYQGGLTNAMENKVKKICDAFGARRYPYPEDKSSLIRLQQDLNSQLQEGTQVISKTRERIIDLLSRMAAPRRVGGPAALSEWLAIVQKEKSIYHTLNLFKASHGKQTLRAECWCPDSLRDEVSSRLSQQSRKNADTIPALLKPLPTHAQPPTYFKLNDFTAIFQEIVDTYGTPQYQEANPALFTCVTFPFLFGIMFGDIGHGSLLLLFGLYLMWANDGAKKAGNEGLVALCKARYILTLMGFFALYVGIMYNDFLSLGLNVWGTTWLKGETVGDKQEWVHTGIYPIGIDPVWHGAENELLFFNSLKMKISVILGVIQMTFGICLKLSNALHFNRKLDIYFEFIPQMIFMQSLFGYMVIMIFIKWGQMWDIYNPPNLINTLINIPLHLGAVAPGDDLYDGQATVQLILFIFAFLSVPVMLLVKPLILNSRHKAEQARGPALLSGGHHAPSRLVEEDDEENQHGDAHHHGGGGGGHGDEHGEFNFGEIMIHQVIETIEFVLGAVSNTASYLRLWALSLAHSQLAEVFFSKAMLLTIGSGNFFMIFIGFAVFFGATIGVLMMMDVLECFLHSLRLHWVEFQNKFYKGDGYKFKPFSFMEVLAAPTD